MATKTISVHLEAYERLRAARRHPSESFSQVILRARWSPETIRGSGLLERLRRHGPHFSPEELDRIDRFKSEERPPEDKWQTG